MKKIFGKVSSQLMTIDQTVDLKLMQQHYIMILPQNILQQFGINSQEIDFDLTMDDSNKLTLVGPKVTSQPKSGISNSERGGFDT